MSWTLAVMVACAAAGMLLQQRGRADRIRVVLWRTNFWVVLPAASLYGLLTVSASVHVAEVLACGVAAAWLTVACGLAWGRLAGRDRIEAGALALAAGFGNRGFIGYPLAAFVFGHRGLTWAVLYDQVGLVIPAVAVLTIIAHSHAGPDAVALGSDDHRRRLRGIPVNPPLWVAGAALAARLGGVPALHLDWLATTVIHVVGPIGFALFGLSLPLHRITHERGDVVRACGSVLVRSVLSPLLVLGIAAAAGVALPGAVVLAAAAPVAFQCLVVARLYDVRPDLARLAVLISTPTVLGVVIAVRSAR